MQDIRQPYLNKQLNTIIYPKTKTTRIPKL